VILIQPKEQPINPFCRAFHTVETVKIGHQLITNGFIVSELQSYVFGGQALLENGLIVPTNDMVIIRTKQITGRKKLSIDD
jgi:hypothetical protein